jgi:hypothetical protein
MAGRRRPFDPEQPDNSIEEKRAKARAAYHLKMLDPEARNQRNIRQQERRKDPKIKLEAKEYCARPEVNARRNMLFRSEKYRLKKNVSRRRSEFRIRRQAIRRALLTVAQRNERIATALRGRLYTALKGKSSPGSAIRDLGCTLEEFRAYIAEQFELGMDWNNWGKWHLDHKKPLNSFDLSVREQFLVAFHYTNYQPLWAFDNISKGARLDWEKK